MVMKGDFLRLDLMFACEEYTIGSRHLRVNSLFCNYLVQEHEILVVFVGDLDFYKVLTQGRLEFVLGPGISMEPA